MKYTNRYGLPPPFVQAVLRDPYSKGKADFSATELIDSPRRQALLKEHDDEIVTDVSDRLFSVLGRGVHAILEEYGRRAGLEDYTEQRFYAKVDGFILSGGMDLWMPGNEGTFITDYKVTSAKSAKAKPEWECQLNIYAWLFEQNRGYQPTGLRICAILRDWSKMKMRGDYPPAPLITIQIPLWSPSEQLAYIRDRITIHASARASQAFGEELPPCTDEEVWRRDVSWAVKKIGGKRASAVYDSIVEAKLALAEKGPGYEIEHRPGEPLRCKEYCEASAFCTQWKTERDRYDQ